MSSSEEFQEFEEVFDEDQNLVNINQIRSREKVSGEDLNVVNSEHARSSLLKQQEETPGEELVLSQIREGCPPPLPPRRPVVPYPTPSRPIPIPSNLAPPVVVNTMVTSHSSPC